MVGFAVSQLYVPIQRRWLHWILAVFLAVLPDIDTFSNAPYGAMLGHRGCTHSFIFALWLAFLVASLSFRAMRANLVILTFIYFAATASHGVLDAFTRGGFAIPLFWPFTEQRFGNWGPIPVSDLGFELPSPWRSRALRIELLWVWLPSVTLILIITICRHIDHKRRH